MHNTKEEMKVYRAEAGSYLRLARRAKKRGKPIRVAKAIWEASGLLQINGLTVGAGAWLKSRHRPVEISLLDKAAIEGWLAAMESQP